MKSSNGRGDKAPSRHLSPLNETSSASSGLYLRSRCRINQPCSWRISSGVGGHFTLQLVCEHSCWGVEMQGTWLCQHHWMLDFRESLNSTLGLGKCSLRCVGLNLGYLNSGLTLRYFLWKLVGYLRKLVKYNIKRICNYVVPGKTILGCCI
jgi:hypothetical protein